MNRSPEKAAPNYDPRTVEGFGQEWKRFKQAELGPEERAKVFAEYFRIFPWHSLPPQAQGADFGCGSGRWAMEVAPRVGTLHCFDASRDALEVAEANLSHLDNCTFHAAPFEQIPLEEASLDFAYCLGVLHHVPDTQAAMAMLVSRLKAGAPFLVYLYYALENRPFWFRLIWRLTDQARRVISRAPARLRFLIADAIALFVYFPVARLSLLLETFGADVQNMPLHSYRRRSFYAMRTDALDRFGTSLEKRFTREEIKDMMEDAGLERIVFSEGGPFWCAMGFRSQPRN